MNSQRRRSLFLRRASATNPGIADVVLEEQYHIIKNLGTGRFSYVVFAEHKESKTQVTLKQFRRADVSKADIFREYNYSMFLCPHPNIITTYQGLYATPETYFFAQEHAPYGSLRDVVYKSGTGLSPDVVKRVIVQVANVLEFMHSEGLVHRNIQAKNVLLFDEDMARVKITDLALTRKEETMVKHFDVAHEYHAPELCDCLIKETYAVDPSVDVWAFGILIYFSLRGKYPWTKATIMHKSYWEWEEWMNGQKPRMPQIWTRFSDRLVKLFRKTLRPSAKDRCDIKDIMHKYVKAKWLKEEKSASEEDVSLPEVESSKDPAPLVQQLSTSMETLNTNKSMPDKKKPRSAFHSWFTNAIGSIVDRKGK